jgi:hypothetical protein
MLIPVMDSSYDEVVSIAIAVDDANQVDLEYKKRKRMQEESSGNNVQCLKIVINMSIVLSIFHLSN